MTGPLELLRDPTGAAALTAAELLVADGPVDPLAAVTALRAQGYPPEVASAALAQARMRQRAVGKFGPDAARMYFTAAGLEQATRAVVADRRAARLAAHGIGRVADLGCGIGADTLAFARAGLSVLAVEADPATAAVAEANAAALDLTDLVEVRRADATTVDLSAVDAVFCDPARRDRGTGRRVFDPAVYSPPWTFVQSLPARVPATVLKVAPGLDHALVPATAEAAWTSVDGDLVEATIWCGPLAEVPRRATVLRGGRTHELTGTGLAEAPVAAVGAYLYDPDAAVVRAHLVAELAADLQGHLADPRIAYLFADRATPVPYARCLEVVAELPFARKRLRAALRGLDIGRLEILKRGLAVEPDQLRRELRLSGSRAATLVLARFGDTPTALLCSPVVPPPEPTTSP